MENCFNYIKLTERFVWHCADLLLTVLAALAMGSGELVRKKSQHCSEGAQGSGKQNEERKLFFGVNGEFMMS